MIRNILLPLLFLTAIGYSQEKYAIANIPSDMLENANAVIRYQNTQIELIDIDNMKIAEHDVVTVLNKRGMTAVKPMAYYDDSSSIQSIVAYVYDKDGKEIRKFKKKDFSDVSASGANLYTDNRMLVLDYTPTVFPFTFEFRVETRSSSTGFLPRWNPSPIYRVSTEFSKYTINNPTQIPLTTQVYNTDEFGVKVTETSTLHSYEVRDLKAIDKERMGPHYTEFTPVAKFAPLRFELEGKKAEVSSWKDFGLWQKRNLLDGRGNLTEATIARVSALVLGMEDPKEKARTIYEFMQSRTRYISVQVGIGGWQPSLASEVDKLGYGDCKGLTNYTQALLRSQGIESYYTIVDSGPDGRDIDENFVALQGDHVILTVPFDDEKVFLECTSQQLPFNYLGMHTDNRQVLMVTPDGGVLTNTHEYGVSENQLKLVATVTLQESLKLSGTLQQSASGIPYGFRYPLENETSAELNRLYKESWSHLNDLSLANISFENNKKDVVFTESMVFGTDGYVSKAGTRILLNPNIFKRIKDIPSKVTNRTQPMEIRRGFMESDEIKFVLPSNYSLESVFEPMTVETKFGSYKATIEIQDDATVRYTRELVINSGRYPKEDYNNYVDFMKKVVRFDRSKIVLIKN